MPTRRSEFLAHALAAHRGPICILFTCLMTTPGTMIQSDGCTSEKSAEQTAQCTCIFTNRTSPVTNQVLGALAWGANMQAPPLTCNSHQPRMQVPSGCARRRKLTANRAAPKVHKSFNAGRFKAPADGGYKHEDSFDGAYPCVGIARAIDSHGNLLGWLYLDDRAMTWVFPNAKSTSVEVPRFYGMRPSQSARAMPGYRLPAQVQLEACNDSLR